MSHKYHSWALRRCLWAFVTFTLTLAHLSFASAQDGSERQECAPHHEGPRRVVMSHEGQPGVWIAEPILNCMVRDLQELTLLRGRVEILHERLDLRDDQIESLRRIVELNEETEIRLMTAVEQAVEAQRAAEERVDNWWRAPALWTSVGLVLAVGLVALSTWVLSEIGAD